MNNLYGKPGYEQITANLKQKIKSLQKQYKDDMSLEEMRAMTDSVVKRVYNEITN
jgi:5-bromo-4-chloroindolyl phosphate hydrolysis protein